MREAKICARARAFSAWVGGFGGGRFLFLLFAEGKLVLGGGLFLACPALIFWLMV